MSFSSMAPPPLGGIDPGVESPDPRRLSPATSFCPTKKTKKSRGFNSSYFFLKHGKSETPELMTPLIRDDDYDLNLLSCVLDSSHYVEKQMTYISVFGVSKHPCIINLPDKSSSGSWALCRLMFLRSYIYGFSINMMYGYIYSKHILLPWTL